MSHWNYRIIRTDDPGDEPGNYVYCVHEVYYDDNDRIEGWTETDVTAVAGSPAELRRVLTSMIRATHKPILEERNNTLVEVEG